MNLRPSYFFLLKKNPANNRIPYFNAPPASDCHRSEPGTRYFFLLKKNPAYNRIPYFDAPPSGLEPETL
ncbi:MAG: hypothetical protein COW63_18150 [Bacteroidetes bacterium CG18_big_fil_WC_8_21_14_2_50_41_14]|nr:MAG: hypothetical protein COW63_18150 [Bacteroidetes bacterium CG18_big_fil_WC_8_21_14_2_50_41_14]